MLHVGCASTAPPNVTPAIPTRESSATIALHGRPFDLHFSLPLAPSHATSLVLYASGDGGWFGSAVGMFRLIGEAGYPVVGLSSRAFLNLEASRGELDIPHLVADYATIVAQATTTLHLPPDTPVILAGWSRGAAFAVLAASQHEPHRTLAGVVAIGLGEGESLRLESGDDDEGSAGPGRRTWPFLPYSLIPALGSLPCAVIQASHDGYLPAARARELFGAEGDARRFYTVEARNHRFSGGQAAFATALLDALSWIAARPPAAGSHAAEGPWPAGR